MDIKTISFRGPTPCFDKIKIGNKMDNLAGGVRFVLHDEFADALIVLYITNGEYSDAITLGEDRVYKPTREHTQYPGQYVSYLEAFRDGDIVWHSDTFILSIGDLPSAGEQIEQRFPTAVESAMKAAAQTDKDRAEVERLANQVNANSVAATEAAAKTAQDAEQTAADRKAASISADNAAQSALQAENDRVRVEELTEQAKSARDQSVAAAGSALDDAEQVAKDARQVALDAEQVSNDKQTVAQEVEKINNSTSKIYVEAYTVAPDNDASAESSISPDEGIRIKLWIPQGKTGDKGYTGDTGATYTPTVSQDGVVSWSNDRGLPNPEPVNITGKTGEKGETGDRGIGIQSVEQTVTSTEDDGMNIIVVTLTDGSTQTFAIKNGSRGNQGIPGNDGKDGEKGDPGYTPVKGVDYFDGADAPQIDDTQDSANNPWSGAKTREELNILADADKEIKSNVDILINELITEHALETEHTQVSYDTEDEEYDVPTSDELDDLRETARINSILNRDGKIYSVKIPKFAASQATICEKMHDNVGLVCEPSTDTVEGRDDYANIPLFRWYNCNYKRLPDGHAYPTAIEGFDGEYTADGDVDVGVIQMAPYIKWDDSNDEYVIFSISDTPHPGFTLWPEAQCGDKKYDYVVHSKYFSGTASDGMPRSQPNLAPLMYQSHNNIITNYAKKGSGYYGAGNARNSWQIVFTLIKYGAKSSQNIFAGCTNYSFQYAASIERTELDTFFPVTNANANNIVIGNSVSIGYGRVSSGAVNIDRYYDNMHTYARMAKVIRIEDIDENNKAVYLDVSEGFPTSPVDLDGTLSSPVYMSSMHCISGSTDAVIAHHDGSPVSNTNGKYAYRVQGIEYAVGGYFVASDTVLDFQSDTSKNVLVAPYGVKHSSSDSTIRSTYMNIGNIPASSDGKSSDYWIGDIKLDPYTGVFYPVSEGSGNTTGAGDRLYAGGNYTSATREWLSGGVLWDGSAAGSSCLHCGSWLGSTSWGFLSAD